MSKELMENVGTIFNIVLSSANKGEKYEKKVPVPGKYQLLADGFRGAYHENLSILCLQYGQLLCGTEIHRWQYDCD